MFKCIFFSFLMVGFSVTGAAGVYKWEDKNGNVHYGDCQPTDCNSEEIELAPAPSAEAVREAQERTRRFQEYEQKISGPRMPEPHAVTKERTRQPSVLPDDIPCFSLLQSTWGGRIADSREPVEPKRLNEDQLSELRALFGELEGLYRGTLGRYRGTMTQTMCLNPDASPPIKTYPYKFVWITNWQSDQIFRIEAELTGAEMNTSGRVFFWFLLSPEGVRFRKATTDTSTGLDRPQYDVGIVDIADDRLTLYLRQGGRIRQTTVLSLQEGEYGFTLNEFFYTQGILSEKHAWEISR